MFITAQKIDGLFKGKKHIQEHRYPFHVLFDESREITRAYGVYDRLTREAFNIARPATFVINRDGKICWIAVSPSQSERPQLSGILSAIEACDKY